MSFLSVTESVKAASEIYSPLSGRVVEKVRVFIITCADNVTISIQYKNSKILLMITFYYLKLYNVQIIHIGCFQIVPPTKKLSCKIEVLSGKGVKNFNGNKTKNQKFT